MMLWLIGFGGSLNIEPTSVLATEINPHSQDYITGIEFIAGYNPSWQARLGFAFQNIQNIGAKWVILTPTWTYTSSNPPQLEQVPGEGCLVVRPIASQPVGIPE